LVFEAGKIQTVAGKLTLKGASGKVLTVKAVLPAGGTSRTATWTIAANGGTDIIDFVSIVAGVNANKTPITVTHSTVDAASKGWKLN
jgi:hypothetical protein